MQGAGHNDVELYNQYLERLRHFVSQELTNWHKAEATETASAASNNHTSGVTNKEQRGPDNPTINTKTTTTTTSSSSLSISNQDSADKNTSTNKNNSEKFLWG